MTAHIEPVKNKPKRIIFPPQGLAGPENLLLVRLTIYRIRGRRVKLPLFLVLDLWRGYHGQYE